MEVEAAVIGGGVVGLACASALARAGKNTVVLERHSRVGTETSARSSEVHTMYMCGAELRTAALAERAIMMTT